ncbi:hypothetical protein KIPB_004421 [Kipferlia bialata]|uniref:Uncharacterized protein n=1 Tax=Kipferlia bialata TaxID=797122 RepID=A0A9K3CUH6_9EUKA|nr:hypothetical protein KIPB_004421 [Kipferlia bialata]|eukprot:g4421.t1
MLYRRAFQKNYYHRDKFLLKCKGKRFIVVEELDEDKLDTALIKEFVSGGNVSLVRIHQAEAESVRLIGKLNFISNMQPVFDVDEGIRRRGLTCLYKNKFVEVPEGQEASLKPRHHRKVKDYVSRFDYIQVRTTFFAMLAQYAKRYYEQKTLGLVPELRDQFKVVCDDNAPVLAAFEEHFVITRDDNDRVYSKEVARILNFELTDIKPALLQIGIKFNRNVRPGKGSPFPQKRGCFLGIQHKGVGEEYPSE